MTVIYAEAVKKLPEPLLKKGVPTARKLTYLWVKENPGPHSARSLHAALGVEVGTALSELRDDGLLIEDVPPAGSRPGEYRAAPVRGHPTSSKEKSP